MNPKFPNITSKPEKKVKINSRSNSFTHPDESKIDDALKPVEDMLTNNDTNFITFLQFKYLIDNLTNKTINIHSLCNDINSYKTIILNVIEVVCITITDRAMKIKFTKLSNFLFQSIALQKIHLLAIKKTINSSTLSSKKNITMEFKRLLQKAR